MAFLTEDDICPCGKHKAIIVEMPGILKGSWVECPNIPKDAIYLHHPAPPPRVNYMHRSIWMGATAQIRSVIEDLDYEDGRKLHAELRRMVTQLEGRHNLGRKP